MRCTDPAHNAECHRVERLAREELVTEIQFTVAYTLDGDPVTTNAIITRIEQLKDLDEAA